MAGYHLRDFTFTPTNDGGVEIVVRTTDSHGAKIVRALHLEEEEMYEMLAAVGLSADEVEDDLDADQEPDDDEF